MRQDDSMDLGQTELRLRIDALEKRVRLLVIALLVTMGVICINLGYALWFRDSRVISPAYVLTDSTGVARGEWSLRNGSPTLVLLDSVGRERVVLVHDGEQSGLFLKDDWGDTRVGAAQFAHGGGGFALHGEHMKGAAVLYYKGSGSLIFFDTTGSVTQRVPVLGTKK